MRYLDFVKKYQNFDFHIVLMDELGYTDEEITTKLEISKQLIYDARKRLEPILEALKNMSNPKALTYGNPDINTVVDAFKEAYGTTKTSTYDRYAAKRLASKHGAKNIVQVIKALASSADDKFCPRVNNVTQLEVKWVSVITYLKTRADNNMVVEL